MAASVRSVNVATEEQLQQAVSSYIVQGYSVANQSASSATMVKKKEFSALWVVVGLILCLLPLLVYLIVYAVQSDSVVEIRLVPPCELGQPAGALSVGGTGVRAGEGDVLLSEDGRYWWDGAVWQDVLQEPPAFRATD